MNNQYTAVFTNLTGDSLTDFCRTSVLSHRPELKCQTHIQFVIDELNEGHMVAVARNTDKPLVVVTPTNWTKKQRAMVRQGCEFRVFLHQGFQ